MTTTVTTTMTTPPTYVAQKNALVSLYTLSSSRLIGLVGLQTNGLIHIGLLDCD